MKKILCFILALTCLVSSLALTSCNTGPGPSTDKTPTNEFQIPEGGYNGEEVTIIFYHSMGSQLTNHVEDAIERFNEIYPNINIELSHYGDYDSVRDQIVTELSTGGTEANVAFCYPDHIALYNSSKATVSLDDLIKSTIQIQTATDTATLGFTEAELNNFVDSYYKEGATADKAGTMYSLPFAKSTEVMYYNKTFFEANNLTVPTTWEELETVCRAIKAIEPDAIPFGYDSEANWFITMAQQYGYPYTSPEGENYLFNDTRNHTFVAKLREMHKAGLVTTKGLLNGSYTSSQFKEESIYMCVGSSAGATYQMSTTFDVGVAPVPQVDPTKTQAISQGPSLCIFNKADAQEVVASWLFVKFLTTDEELQCRYSMSNGYVPVIKSAYENETYKTWLEDANHRDGLPALVAQYTIDHAGETFTSAVFRGSSKARDQVGILINNCLGGNTNGKSDLDFIKEQFENAIYACKFGK